MIEQAVVTITDEALGQLQTLLEQEGNPDVGLRLFVSGGGCSGLQYGMAFDDEIRAGDEVVE
ncbi:MAG: HesB/IscA family protein, partial [Candidatus Dormibacteraceae bacterium]